MKSIRKLKSLLAAAVCVTLASQGFAQYRVGTDGRAGDASNLVGSNGYNTAVSPQQSINQGNYVNNLLITGNTTGGREFRTGSGGIGYSAPDAFHGNLGSSGVDRFIQGSSGAAYGGVPQNNAQTAQPYFGTSYGAPPPAGFVPQSLGSGAMVPAPQMVPRSSSDLRLSSTVDASGASLPQPGQFLSPGQVDPSGGGIPAMTASPLFGSKSMAGNGQSFASNKFGQPLFDASGQRVDTARLQQMQNEVLQPDDLANDPSKPKSQVIDNAAPKPMDAPQNQSISTSAALQSNRPMGAAMATDLTAAVSAGRSRTLAPPEQQSTQYAELRKRLQENRVAQAAMDSAVQNNTPAPKTDASATGTRPLGQGLGASSGVVGMPAASAGAASLTPQPAPIAAGGAQATPNPTMTLPAVPGVAQRSAPTAPLQVHSLADGVQAKGLADVLKEAEKQMRAEKYNAAIDEFDMAERIAPNNPMITLGRAIAEMGQSYYLRAETHLRQAIMSDQALLMGQYDVRSLLGNERLEFIVNDLKGISQREQKEPRSMLLLSFLAYNTGNERQAAAFLDVAEKRAGGKDPIYPMIRKHWALPADVAAPDMNK